MAIVGNQHHGPGKGLQGHAQGMTHIQIQMIGRLVEQQQIGLPPDQQGQHQARLFAAGKALNRRCRHRIAKTKASQIGSQAGLCGIRIQLLQMRKRRTGILQLLHLMLRKIPDAQLRGCLAGPGQGGQLAGQHSHQRRFARAIGAQKANPVSRLQAKVQVRQNAPVAIARRHMLQAQ